MLGGMGHVATMVREVWVSQAVRDINEKLPAIIWASLGAYRYKIQFAVQGRAARCYKCAKRGHMRNDCTYCATCKTIWPHVPLLGQGMMGVDCRIGGSFGICLSGRVRRSDRCRSVQEAKCGVACPFS